MFFISYLRRPCEKAKKASNRKVDFIISKVNLTQGQVRWFLYGG